ncbi:MAG: hypothetical protein GMKNLPBB_02918 [Myxococcota bacterium]|nr:hypothetical protein [Myxococcota bacterium]
MEAIGDLLFHVWDFINGPVLFLLGLFILAICIDKTGDGCAGIIVFILVLAGTGWIFRSCQDHRLKGPTHAFISVRGEYSELHRLPNEHLPPYVTQKILAIDPSGNISPLHLKIPKGLRATKADEVGTVLIVEYTEDIVGHYQGGGKALVNVCTVNIVDVNARRKLATRVFRGTAPPSAKPWSGSDASGSSPNRDVLKFIRKLPRRAAIEQSGMRSNGIQLKYDVCGRRPLSGGLRTLAVRSKIPNEVKCCGCGNMAMTTWGDRPLRRKVVVLLD